MVAGRAGLSEYRELLRNRGYRLWFLSSLGSSLGDWVGLFSLQVLVISLAEPGSRVALFGLGGIMMARLLPSVLFGPIAGVVADRYDRKRLMTTADALRGVLYLGIAFSGDLIALFTLAFLIECLSLVYISSKMASLPAIVEGRQLTKANQLALFVTYGPMPFGALLPTLMVGLVSLMQRAGAPAVNPTRFALVLTALGFWVAGLIISRLQLPARGRSADPGQEPDGLLQDLRAGAEFIRDLPLIRSLIMGVVGVFFGAGVVVTLGPEFVRTSLQRSETDWFTLMSLVGVGLLVGILLVPVLTGRFREERLFPVFLTSTAAIATIVALLTSFTVTLVAGMVLGGSAGIAVVLGYTLLHRHTPNDVRGKTFAAFFTATRIAMFAALGLAPFVAGAIGIFTLGAGGGFVTVSGLRMTLLAGGVVALLSAASAWRGMYRALRAGEDDGERPIVGLHQRPTRTNGLFIVFEGVEGSGKSTQVRALVQRLHEEDHDIVVTREPGGTPVAERVREVLLDPGVEGMHPRTEALLHAAARAEHVQRVIGPALQQGKTVVCDRFLDSSVAYQGTGRELGEDAIYELNRWAIAGIEPDVVVLLDLDVEQGLARAQARSGPDRMEQAGAEFHQRVASAYRSLAERHPHRIVVVDAGGDIEAVAARVRRALGPWLGEGVDEWSAETQEEPTRLLHREGRRS